VRERVVRRGKIITAAGVSAGIDMALTLAAAGPRRGGRAGAAAHQEYDPAPPFDAGSPEKAGPAAVERAMTAMAEVMQTLAAQAS
jgi:transcriptional regulator GlxA family with amidase domain